jgi:hypothetical protein
MCDVSEVGQNFTDIRSEALPKPLLIRFQAFLGVYSSTAVLNLLFFFKVNDTSHLMLWHPTLTAHGVGRSN